MDGKDRPPADKVINEVFFDKKCGYNETHDLFFTWCSRAPINQKVKAQCSGLTGTDIVCDFRGAFVDNNSSNIDDLPEYVPDSDATTVVPSYPEKLPEYWSYRWICDYGGPTKITNTNGTEKLDSDQADQIIMICRQELYGVQGLPLWLILLIIFLVLSAVTVSAGLFWKYYIKKKFYGHQHSTRTGSQWTSAPYQSSDGKSKFSRFSLTRRSGSIPTGSSNMKLISGQSSGVPIGSSQTRLVSGQSSAVPISNSSTKINSTSRAPSVATSMAPSRVPSKAPSETSRRSKTPSIRS